jgi:hypothetical protein
MLKVHRLSVSAHKLASILLSTHERKPCILLQYTVRVRCLMRCLLAEIRTGSHKGSRSDMVSRDMAVFTVPHLRRQPKRRDVTAAAETRERVNTLPLSLFSLLDMLEQQPDV